MADFQAFSITPLAAASVNMNRVSIACKVTNSNTGALIADFTGANAITWPDVLSTLTAAQRQEIHQLIVTRLIQMKAGLG